VSLFGQLGKFELYVYRALKAKKENVDIRSGKLADDAVDDVRINKVINIINPPDARPIIRVIKVSE